MSPTPPSPQHGRLHGRVAIITGSSGRLGRAVSLLFASEGATLFLVDKYSTPRNPINATTGKADDWESRYDHSKHTSTNPNLPPTNVETEQWLPTHGLITLRHPTTQVHFHATDLTDEQQVKTMIEASSAQHRHIDILINAHGISVESTHPAALPIHTTPLSDFTTTLSINTTSLFLTMKHFLAQVMTQPQRHASARAWIVNVASVQALTPYYGTSSYCASKGAALMLTKQVALDYAPVGVRCNAICPGFLDSDMTRNLQGDERLLATVAERHPLRGGVGMEDGTILPGTGPGKGGLGKVEDVARMVLVLAGDDAVWMTGQAVVVDGGYSIS